MTAVSFVNQFHVYVPVCGTIQGFQSPVKLAFAMTINNSQGQTMQKVGIYLRRPWGVLCLSAVRQRDLTTLYISVICFQCIELCCHNNKPSVGRSCNLPGKER